MVLTRKEVKFLFLSTLPEQLSLQVACMHFRDVKSMVAYLLTIAKQDLHAETDFEADDSSSYDGDVSSLSDDGDSNPFSRDVDDEDDGMVVKDMWQIDLGCEEKQECSCVNEALCKVRMDEVHFDEGQSASKDVLNTDVADDANPSVELDVESVLEGIGDLFDGEELDNCVVESMSEGVTASSGPEEPEETVQVMTPEEMDCQESVSETASEVTNPSPSKVDEVSVECVQLDAAEHCNNEFEESEVDRDVEELDPELEALLDEAAMGFLVLGNEIPVLVPFCHGEDQLEIPLMDGYQLDEREDESLINDDAEFDAMLDGVLEDFVCCEAKQEREYSGSLKACEIVEALAGELEIPCTGDGEQDLINGASSVQDAEEVELLESSEDANSNVEPGNSLMIDSVSAMCEEYASTMVNGMSAKALDQAYVEMDSDVHVNSNSKYEGQF